MATVRLALVTHRKSVGSVHSDPHLVVHHLVPGFLGAARPLLDHVELVPRLAGVEELVAGGAGLVAQVAQRAVLRELELEPLEELDAAEHLRQLPEVLLRPLLRRL